MADYGFVTGTLVLPRGDDSAAGVLEVEGAAGVRVAFIREGEYATTNPPRLVVRDPTMAATMDDGQITDDLNEDGTVASDATPGVWLLEGTYTVSTYGKYPNFPIVVTAEHTETSPLDLALALDYAPPAGVVVQTVKVPLGAEYGQTLVWTETGAAWAHPAVAEGFVTSVNGLTGDVVIDSGDFVEQTDPRLSDAREPLAHDHAEYVEDTDPRLSDAREPLAHDHPEYVNPDLSTYVETTDPRLSDAREPLAHTHPEYVNPDLSTYVETTDPRLSDARTPTAHDHDDRYYTETETDTLLSGKADAAHDHDATYVRTVNGTGPDAAGDVVVEASGGGGGGASTAPLAVHWYPEHMGDWGTAHGMGANDVLALQAIPVPHEMTVDALTVVTTNGVYNYYSRFGLWDADGNVLADSGRMNTNKAGAWTVVLSQPITLPPGLYLAGVTCNTTSQSFKGAPKPWVRRDAANDPTYLWMSHSGSNPLPSFDPSALSASTAFIPAYVLLRTI